LHADALAYVAELCAAGTVRRLPALLRRATATGGVYAAISEEEEDGDEMSDEMSAR
jgi:hypothetical protein